MKYVLLFKLLSLLTITTQQDTFEVLGGSVVVLAGENATLPCHLKPSISAVNVKVKWIKIKSSDNISTVHVYENQKDVEAVADSTYLGRTSLFREELQKGNVSLKLIHAKFSDSGQYICGVLTANWNEGAAEVTVSVKGEGSLPMVSIRSPSDWGLEVLCKSTGWHPQPELVWLNSNGQVLPAKLIETSRGQDGLYDIKGLVVAQTNSDQITCRIQQQFNGHMLQTKIDVPNDLFPKSKMEGLIIGSLLTIVFAVVIILLCCVHKRRINTEKAQSWARSGQNTTCIVFKKRHGSEDETAVLKDGKDVNVSFMQFAKSHIIQNENLKKQLDFLNTRKLDYSDVVKCHRTINLDADNAHVDLEVNDKDVQNTGKHPQSFEPNTLEPGTEHVPVEGSKNTVEPASNTHQRFKKAPCVLAKEGFSFGSHYFIVEVPKNGWIVGVVKASINKENTSGCTVQEGCWTLRHRQGKISIHDGTMLSLFMTRETEKVGVFVNYDESFVSFYNVTHHDNTDKSGDHIYTYTNCKFENCQEVYPFFGIGSLKTQNSKLIIVDPVTND